MISPPICPSEHWVSHDSFWPCTYSSATFLCFLGTPSLLLNFFVRLCVQNSGRPWTFDPLASTSKYQDNTCSTTPSFLSLLSAEVELCIWSAVGNCVEGVRDTPDLTPLMPGAEGQAGVRGRSYRDKMAPAGEEWSSVSTNVLLATVTQLCKIFLLG